jgi:hypothetical protein
MIKGAWLPVVFLLAGCSESVSVGETRHDRQSIELDQSERAHVDLKMVAGELVVSGGATKLMEAEFTYNLDRLKPVVEHRSTDGRREIDISQTGAGGFTFGNTTSRWDLRLNDGVLLDVVAKIDAGQVDLKLGSLNLSRVDIGIGAGELHVDLRGIPKRSYYVRINGGVGETVVYLPRSAGISATAAGGIGGINVEGLQRSGDHWINPGHESDPVQISVDVKSGVGEIRLVAQ